VAYAALFPEYGGSENIRVISVMGRFLEHSRAYYFKNGGHAELFLGSADMMQRNLDHRVETLFPVLDEVVISRVLEDLELLLADNVKAWTMDASGSYSLMENDQPAVNSQVRCLERVAQKKISHILK